MLSQMANNIANFMGRKPGVDRNRHIVKPRFGFIACCPNVNVCGFIALIRIKEGAIGPQRITVGTLFPYPPSLGSAAVWATPDALCASTCPTRGNDHTGKLSCLRPGISTVFPRSIARARAMRGRVAWGMITSSM